jgi:hypothetical protein
MKDARAQKVVEKEDEDNFHEEMLRVGLRDMLKEENESDFWERLYNREHQSMPMTTDVSRGERAKYLQAQWFAETFHQDWLAKMIQLDFALRVSERRRGRREAVAAMTGSIEEKSKRFAFMKRGEG